MRVPGCGGLYLAALALGGAIGYKISVTSTTGSAFLAPPSAAWSSAEPAALRFSGTRLATAARSRLVRSKGRGNALHTAPPGVAAAEGGAYSSNKRGGGGGGDGASFAGHRPLEGNDALAAAGRWRRPNFPGSRLIVTSSSCPRLSPPLGTAFVAAACFRGG
ncbi:unnamed protein product, partial [Pylaiella littoralis]